jgi:glutamate-ammonia-ligase adenylyltransferase
VLYAPFDLEAFARILSRQLDDAQGDTERQMNVLREAHQAQVFRLLAQDLAGVLTVERLADHLSALADVVLEETIRRAWRDLRARHREGEPRFAVIGYGKLGGKELGYASDLDIIFLYEDTDERAGEVYARLGQRINHWLSSRTSSGILFETDLALRPSGASGLLVSSVDAFQRYQEESAWTWEHQALTRARFSAGDRNVGEKFEGIRTQILRRPRDGSALKKEILQMREKMLAAHPNRSGLFDLKHDRGGMIDIEFAVQCLVLGHSHRHPDLTGNLGNIALLRMAAGHGLIDAALAERCRDAYREFRRLQHALRSERRELRARSARAGRGARRRGQPALDERDRGRSLMSGASVSSLAVGEALARRGGELLVAAQVLAQLLLVELFEIEDRVMSALGGADQLVELDLHRHRVAVLGVLDHEHHQESDDGRGGVDHQLPGVAEAEERATRRPQGQ